MISVNYPREIMANELLKRGHATMIELLTASFGEWPPKGLDINPDIPHDQQVVFKSFLKRTLSKKKTPRGLFYEMTCVFGRASIRDERVIYINGLLCRILPGLLKKSDLGHVLSHETLHSLQGDNFYRAEEIFGRQQAEKIWQERNDSTSFEIMAGLNNYDGQFHKGRLRAAFNRVANFFKGIPGLPYLKNGGETQAFFHESLMEGYRRWGKMPQNRDDLWAALVNMGLQPPAEISKYLEALPENSGARDFMKGNIFHTVGANNLQAIADSLSKQARDIFWSMTLPALYSDMIEMYGDRQGRERFGFGVNTKALIQQAAFGSEPKGPPLPPG